MTKYFESEVGSAPSEEMCAEVGFPNYAAQSRRECEAFKAQILRHYPIPEGVDAGVRISVSPHDFGSYREVAVAYMDEAGCAWATSVEQDEKGVLAHWDDQALNELGFALKAA